MTRSFRHGLLARGAVAFGLVAPVAVAACGARSDLGDPVPEATLRDAAPDHEAPPVRFDAAPDAPRDAARAPRDAAVDATDIPPDAPDDPPIDAAADAPPRDACTPWAPPRPAVLVAIDGVDVWFEALPASDITTGLTPTNVSPGAHFSEGSTNDWGATNPFQFSPSLAGSPYDALWAGRATYAYGAPQAALDILWGTIDPSNALELVDEHGAVVATITGADLRTAAENALGSEYVWGNGVHVAVVPPTPFWSATTIGGADLTFEYANLVVSPACAP